MSVVGTAGHVDHGKSTLVQALTGRDPDRWAEEKRRGLTIDLGFAWAVLPGGSEVSFVDVPGHERFAKNMLAGIETIDVALLAVAADEGWKPQSEEHLAVLDLLEIEHSVVALTKADRVDPDLLELATLETNEKLEGTRLSGARVIPTAAPAGIGIDDLRHALSELLPQAVAFGSRPRMWIDRSFSISGAGTVVTGTLTGGPLSVGDHIVIWPGPLQARVRGIQSHEQDLARVGPGRRVAVNLAGVDRSQIARGALLGLPGQWHPTRRAAITLQTARYVQELQDRGAYHIHIGSGAWPVRLHILGDGVAVVDLPQALCLEVGDRFILRDTGRRLVVGGGRVIDPEPARPARAEELRRLAVLPRVSPDLRAGALLQSRGAQSLTALAAQTGGGRPDGAIIIGERAFHPDYVEALTDRMMEVVDDYHARNPLRPGIGVAELSTRLGLGADATVRFAERHPGLEIDGAHVRRSTYSIRLRDDQEAAWKRAKALLNDAGAGEVARIGELGLSDELVHALVRQGELVQISADIAYLPAHVERLADVIRSFDSPFSVSEFKDRAGLSRKYAVPFLEWADEAGLTVRMGDRRRAR